MRAPAPPVKEKDVPTPTTRIDGVEVLLLDVPTIRPHRLAMTTMNRQTLVIVRVRCSDGSIGLGEGTTIGGLSYGCESPEGIALTIETFIAPLLQGLDADRVGPAMTRIGQAVKGNHFAKCAVETALLDALARRRGLPLAEMLGGRFRDTLPVAWTLASGDTARDIEEAERMLDARRHRVFKLKIGARPLAEDLAHVAAITRALDGRAAVRVDVNQAWSEPTAARGMAALQDAGVELVEQPVARGRNNALARLSVRFDVPVMADEALHGPEDAFALAATGAARVFAVKIAQSGGLDGAARVAHIADSAGIGLYGGTMLEGGIGTVAAAQLFATFPRLDWGTELFGPLLLTEEILAEPLHYADFALHVPRGPGLGVSLDEDRVAFFRRGAARRLHSLSCAPMGA
jgi:muconate cycloisomerase